MAAKTAVKWFMRQELDSYDLFITQKVGDILFGGYKDKLTSSLAKFEKFIEKLEKILRIKIKIDAPSAISKDGYFSLLGQVRVGWFTLEIELERSSTIENQV